MRNTVTVTDRDVRISIEALETITDSQAAELRQRARDYSEYRKSHSEAPEQIQITDLLDFIASE